MDRAPVALFISLLIIAYMKHLLKYSTLLLLFVSPHLFGAEPAQQKPPNIIYIMADDLGYGDVSCYNKHSLIRTPHIDRLAAQGLRFTDAHSPSAVCTPTRYGVLTGRYCWRTWLKRGVVGGYTPPLIEPDRPTIATLLKGGDYTTACIGKWHLGLGWTRANGITPAWKEARSYFRGSWQDGDASKGLNVDFTKPVRYGPEELGFDSTFYTAACSTIDGPFAFIQNRRLTALPDEMIEVDRSKHPDFRPRPGWVAPDYDIETVDVRFTRHAINLMDLSIKKHAGTPFFLYLALSAPHAPWLPPEMVQGKSDAGPRGDQVVLVDWCVGQIMKFLKEHGLADSTLVIFTSDNGPRHGINGHKSAGDLRGYKSHIWEGGHRVPFIARWPERVPKGKTTGQPLCLTDMFATFAALLNVDVPEGAAPDSFNLLPAFLGTAPEKPIRPHLIHHSENGTFSIRKGEWKLILNNKTSGGWVKPSGKPPKPGTPGQLYNIETDPYETDDVFEQHPEVVKKLTALLEKFKSQGRSNAARSPAGE